MSYLRHVIACNRFNPELYVPFSYRDQVIGEILGENIAALADFPDIFVCRTDSVAIKPLNLDRRELSQRFEDLLHILVERGKLRHFRHEPFAVSKEWGSPILFELDRGGVPFFGTRAYGVHVNGYRRRRDSFDLWIGRRSPTKSVAPDKLDNIIGGGISAGHSVRETLIKEAEEEASMSSALAARAHSVSSIAYRMSQPGGLRNDTLFVFDLEVPQDFVPAGNDGEIVAYTLMPIEECLRLVRETDDFKFNVNLVLIDFAIRHGIIGPDMPEYLRLIAGLRAGLSWETEKISDLSS